MTDRNAAKVTATGIINRRKPATRSSRCSTRKDTASLVIGLAQFSISVQSPKALRSG